MSELIAIEPLVDSHRGLQGLLVLDGDDRYFLRQSDPNWTTGVASLFESPGAKRFCWDIRRLVDLPIPLFERQIRLYDLRTIYGGEKELFNVSRQFLTDDEVKNELTELHNLKQSHLRAARTAKIDTTRVNLTQIMPTGMFERWLNARVRSIAELAKRALGSNGPEKQALVEYEERFEFIQALHEVELNGIRIDEELVKTKTNEKLDPVENKFFRGLATLNRNGYVTALFNPIGGKTGRVKIEGGFNAQAIPHKGDCRKAIISRFPDGKIYSFDFNAIDFRCIVNSIEGEFAKIYRGCEDFHDRTASLIFKNHPTGLLSLDRTRRDAIKSITHAYNYGGSPETLAEKTGLSVQKVQEITEKLDKKLRPVAEFREKLYGQAQKDGFVETPYGRRVTVEPGDHPGKVLGLYAQTCSSFVFEQAFVAAHKIMRGTDSRILFSVHDELVVDISPWDEARGLPHQIQLAMQNNRYPPSYTVRVKKGKTYAEVN